MEDLSTWYVRRNRDRFNEFDLDAQTTLKFAIENLAKVSSPIMPFVAETLYQSLANKESVHLQDWPKFNEKKINKTIINAMKLTREIVSLGLKARDEAKIPLKQPLSKLIVINATLDKKYLDLIAEEMNVKEVKLEKGKELKVELDTNITPELEAEGFAREISRAVQSERKKYGLVKENLIELNISCEKDFEDRIKKFSESISDRVNAKKITFSNKNFENLSEISIKNSKIHISFKKLT